MGDRIISTNASVQLTYNLTFEESKKRRLLVPTYEEYQGLLRNSTGINMDQINRTVGTSELTPITPISPAGIQFSFSPIPVESTTNRLVASQEGNQSIYMSGTNMGQINQLAGTLALTPITPISTADILTPLHLTPVGSMNNYLAAYQDQSRNITGTNIGQFNRPTGISELTPIIPITTAGLLTPLCLTSVEIINNHPVAFPGDQSRNMTGTNMGQFNHSVNISDLIPITPISTSGLLIPLRPTPVESMNNHLVVSQGDQGRNITNINIRQLNQQVVTLQPIPVSAKAKSRLNALRMAHIERRKKKIAIPIAHVRPTQRPPQKPMFPLPSPRPPHQ